MYYHLQNLSILVLIYENILKFVLIASSAIKTYNIFLLKTTVVFF
jgi:hypothetical protein